ncbi:hypothetical protein D9C73_027855 [Collichthys lucidus]|uniref:Uncharacterized protein n=1 Tax=Collichthys lucidus TaxID=240159 RepID=A0A4U5TW05_COLLU|nr:hypothetical protein D9C73_027855 [Collichthys lucidus]
MTDIIGEDPQPVQIKESNSIGQLTPDTERKRHEKEGEAKEDEQGESKSPPPLLNTSKSSPCPEIATGRLNNIGPGNRRCDYVFCC